MKVSQHKPFGSEADILDRLVNERPVQVRVLDSRVVRI